MPERVSSWKAYSIGQRIGLSALLLLAVVAPLLFGVPIPTLFSGADANFAIHEVQAYTAAVRAGDWLPRWDPSGNSGFGAPVFYFYGRLPFLVAAVVGLVLRLGPIGALLWTIALSRFAAFFTCRAWLRRHAEPHTADLGALTFVAMPFAMMSNPLIRVGFAEIFATALLPLLFLLVERDMRDWRSALRQLACLGLVYAALAAIHLPQLVLGFAVVSLYALLVRGIRNGLVNLGGLLLGLLLSADNALPAVVMQPLINPGIWTQDRYDDVRNNFLFSLARLHMMHTLIGELLLYATWFLCCALAVALLVRERKARRRRSLAVGLALLLTLLAMTPVFRIVWVSIPQLRALQFPWRLLPAALALAGAAVALLVAGFPRRKRVATGLLTVLILAQLADIAGGAVIYLSRFGQTHHIPAFIAWRVPAYVPWSERALPSEATRRTIPPEYIPRVALDAGWRLGPQQIRLLPRPGSPALPAPPPPSLHVSTRPNGTLSLQGSLPAAATLDLPLFCFPDERALGQPAAEVQCDPATGFARLALPPGPIRLTITHSGVLRAVALGRLGSLTGCVLVVLCLLAPLSRRTRTQAPGIASPA